MFAQFVLLVLSLIAIGVLASFLSEHVRESELMQWVAYASLAYLLVLALALGYMHLKSNLSTEAALRAASSCMLWKQRSETLFN